MVFFNGNGVDVPEMAISRGELYLFCRFTQIITNVTVQLRAPEFCQQGSAHVRVTVKMWKRVNIVE